MNLRWLLLSTLSLLLVALPAEASRLIHWRFEPRQQRLTFTTAGGVQPRASLIANPTRLVIDLPGTALNQPSVERQLRGAIAEIRVGQFDRRTTRIVVELQPGYTLDPEQVKFQGLAPTQWVVDLPTPQRLAAEPSPATSPALPESSASTAGTEYFQVTRTGFFTRFGYDSPRDVQVRRTANSDELEVDLIGVQLPAALANQTLALNEHGVRSVRFAAVGSGTGAIARLTLQLTAGSPDWVAALSGFGVTLAPQGKVATRPTAPSPVQPTPTSNRLASIPVPPPARPDYIDVPRSWQDPSLNAPPLAPQPSPTYRPPPPPARPTPNPYAYRAQPPVPGRPLVAIDPGHGGRDPGAIGIGGLREVDVVLPISLEVAQILEQNGISVMLTRNSDYFVTLGGRTQMANRAGAHAFVSIHANAVGGQRSEVNGVETYYYSSGRALADVIQRSILQTVPSRNRGVRQARFYVLRHSAMPAVLVEVGFVTGYTDSRNLSNPAYRSQMARAIAMGIIQYVRGGR